MSITLRSDMRVELVESSGSDLGIAQSAWVMEPGDTERDQSPEAVSRLIRAMMKGRHGSPFEAGYFKFFVEAPIFVFREWHRHRIGWSYNETSARYKHLLPVFWTPSLGRKIKEPDGFKPMRPEHSEASAAELAATYMKFEYGYQTAWLAYTSMIDNGIAREVARAVLPVGIFTSMYCCCNPRSLMSFISLRTRDERAAVPSYPQAEIDDVARQIEAAFAEKFPATYASFNANGRIAP